MTAAAQVLQRWNADAALAFASAAISRPPARPHITRVEPVGEFVARFVLPLELCPTLNAFAEMPSWKRQQIKRNALAVMMMQAVRTSGLGRRRANPLTGRPFVRAIRFSSVEPDRDSGWTKVPVDRLTVKRDGLRFILDDRPSAIDLHAWWESAPPKRGCVLIDVWTGES